jgi:putative Flp pilus-assembly TadE/G-like protein
MPARSDRGSTIPLIVGFAGLLLVAGAVVVDATAAYLQRQGLDTLADGAALRGADLGAEGLEVYAGGLGADRLRVSEQAARAAVSGYLRDVGAYRRFPGLSFDVAVGEERVVVRLHAPADLPLHVPGSPDHPLVGASGSAVVELDPE